MDFGTIVELNQDITQGFTTFEKGTKLAVAYCSPNRLVKLNAFGEQKSIVSLVVLYWDELHKLDVVGIMIDSSLPRKCNCKGRGTKIVGM
jgi:hypothetical protein